MPDKKVVVQYGSMGDHMGIKMAKRNTFLIDPKGKIVQVWTGVNPSQHSEQVLTALKRLREKVAFKGTARGFLLA